MRAITVVIATSLVALQPATSHAQVTAIPCVSATEACERWVMLGGAARSMIYSTYPLEVPNAKVTRALIMVHGANRNADHYFATATAAGFLAGALDNTVIIAPHFTAGNDKPAPNEIVWSERGDTWRSGGTAVSNPNISSFDLVDDIVRKLADKRTFPNLTHIVVTGHSAGGQFATRYEMANKVDGTLNGVSISYVVANPSSYAWPSALRPLPVGNADPATADREALGANGEKLNTSFTFSAFDATRAPNYDRWPMGLEARTGYTAQMSDAQLKKQLAQRPTTYLLGQVDVLPLGGFDSSPSAMAQGPTRRARGEAFFKFITDSLGARQRAIIVPECGHNDRCIYTTDVVFPVIFPQ